MAKDLRRRWYWRIVKCQLSIARSSPDIPIRFVSTCLCTISRCNAFRMNHDEWGSPPSVASRYEYGGKGRCMMRGM
eukprot:3550926-Rhodomonas_salina.1